MIHLIAFPVQATAPTLMTAYTVRAVVYSMVGTGLIAIILIGAFIILNYGMMSRRPNDQTGKRTPSVPGFYKGQMWPDEPYEENTLPAEEPEVPEAQDERKKAG